jgi:ribose 5-phosphate isomerase A
MSLSSQSELESRKRAAAARAVDEVENGMVVGLGSGTTAAFALEALAVRVANGLRISGIPTSERTAALARQLNIPLTGFDAHRRIDLTIDGADEVERHTLDLIKGLGGALLREKIVAVASDRMIVAVDDSKLVDRLGTHARLPVEIASFGWQVTIDRLTGIGCSPRLRMIDERPFMTDGGNLIVDCAFDGTIDRRVFDALLASVIGVVESGLFIGLASKVMVGRADGAEVIER